MDRLQRVAVAGHIARIHERGPVGVDSKPRVNDAQLRDSLQSSHQPGGSYSDQGDYDDFKRAPSDTRASPVWQVGTWTQHIPASRSISLHLLFSNHSNSPSCNTRASIRSTHARFPRPNPRLNAHNASRSRPHHFRPPAGRCLAAGQSLLSRPSNLLLPSSNTATHASLSSKPASQKSARLSAPKMLFASSLLVFPRPARTHLQLRT